MRCSCSTEPVRVFQPEVYCLLCLFLTQQSPRREVVRSSAGADPYTPEAMILDVYPLVKSLFCLTQRSPNGFFDFEASIPLKLNVTF